MMPRLYDSPISGNTYKVRLLLHLLGIEHERVDLDIERGETRTPEFLAKNPNGRVPVLELGDSTCLAESDAILFYLAEGTPWLPHDRLGRGQALQWMFFEQYSHEPYIAVVRHWVHLGIENDKGPELDERKKRGYQALDVMEGHLADRDWFVGADRGAPSIADIALYAYTHVAHEGGFDLQPYPAIRAWLERLAAVPGFVPMKPA